MKLVRYGRLGKEKPGLVDGHGKLRDLSEFIPELGPAQLAPRSLARIAKLKPEELPLVRGRPRLGVPFSGSTKFVAIGLNYSDHAAETGNPIPSEPIIFHKTLTCMQGADDDIMLPRESVKTDWEIELGIVIGTRASYVPKEHALEHVAGYVMANDVSERSYQLERGPTWDRGKGCDTFGPIGPWLVTKDEIPDPQALDMWLEVNGERMQTGNTRTMIFDCATLVSYVSEFMSLYPGDLIVTGTPPGVGHGCKPPRYLKPGDHITMGIAGLGQASQKVLKYQANGA